MVNCRGNVPLIAHKEIEGGYGDIVEITPLESLNRELVESERGDFATRYQRMMGQNVSLGFQAATSNLGITFTDEGVRRLEALRRKRARQEIKRQHWPDRVRQKWIRSRAIGRTSINDSDEGNEFVTNEML